ncbi:MAG: LacI family transcriptional regulator [Opitutaceae bacterium]|nr:LacI family transcriptional regulator [Opitutaceae bacterium]
MAAKSKTSSASAAVPVNIKSLARLVGVSIGTVSRALNNRYGVNPDTRRRVLEAARAHHFLPNGAARRLRHRPSLQLGLFFAPYYGPNREINPAALNLIETLRASLAEHGAELRVLYYKDDEDLRAQAEGVDVGLFYGHFEAPAFHVAHALGVPAILYDKRSAHEDQVSLMADTGRSCGMAVQYLAALGHERIAMVTGPSGEQYFHNYLETFPAAMAEFNLPVRPEWVVTLDAAACNKDGARDAVLPLLKKRVRPTAIIFASDWLAIGGRKAARDAGLRVPDDISLIGYDNLPITSELDPPLTTFDVHIPRVVETLTLLATQLGTRQRRAARGALRKEYLITPDFVKRQSCRCLRPARGKPGA